jgi:hypothetical protein
MQGLKWIAAGALMALAVGGAPALAADAPGQPCEVGVYRLADGALVDVAPEGKGLRWRRLDGRTGSIVREASGAWAGRLGFTRDPDPTVVAFGPCGSSSITFAGVQGSRVELAVTDTTFRSGGETLAGRLVLPPGESRVPVMVVGHGSERSSALETAFRQRLYPAAGVGVFVYDKRGTGKSTGHYTQDFDVLAGDAAAAMTETRRLAGARGSRFGFQGGSQAGWVLPLAAQKVPADFVIIGYGIADSPLVEDRTETLQDLTAAGWGPDVLAKAREVTDATGAVIASRFTSGFDALRAVTGKYGKEPWFKDLNGEFTGEIVKYPEQVLRVEGPKRDEGTSWDFDAVGSLRRLPAPLLWMIAGADTEGAGPETAAHLFALQREGRPITVAVFPNTEHGIHLLRTGADGAREEIGYSAGYFPIELDFARGRLAKSYGGAEVHLPTAAPR